MNPKLDFQMKQYFAESATWFPPLLPDASVLDRRARIWAIAALTRTPLPPSVKMNDVILNLPSGATRVRIFHGHNGSDEPVPLIVYFHGGGWVIGDVETHTGSCARLAHEANAIVASVDYPLAPESSWEKITVASYEAAFALANDRNLIAPGAPLALVGDSAGAHLATVTAIRARDEASFRIKLQGLLYPCIEPEFDTPSYNECAKGPSLTKADMRWYWQQFAGADQSLADYRIAPSRANSLEDVAPVYMVTAGCDPLCDDGRRYTQLLRKCNVHVTHDEFDSLPHGFLRFPKYSHAVGVAISRINHQIGNLLRA
jgi:acetyl esterase